ncbi:hypothetical protein BB558_000944 [Smittium angustum]|uniref:Uncharacterized protein n=1 Tax=Smittium angustum TaxID=133377 RepID=A0A2U1JCS7_SMIAN|nr:hypothetical protein BB558_000944 [Smittium angustum]
MSLRLYWPKNSLNENEGGFLVGWFVGKSDLVVATIVKFQDAILLKKAAPALNQQKAYNPRVVGILCGSKYGSLDHWTSIRRPENNPIWIYVCLCGSDLNIRAIDSNQDMKCDKITFIFYEQFDYCSRRFYININNSNIYHTTEQDNSEKAKNSCSFNLDTVLSRINASSYVAFSIQNQIEKKNPRDSDSPSIKNLDNKLFDNILRFLNQSFFGYRLTEIFGVAHLAEDRIIQVVSWRSLYNKSLKSKYHTFSSKNAEYFEFWNSVFRMFFDIALGCFTGYLLISNVDYMVMIAKEFIGGYTITSLENGLLWLRSWPAGLKLNTGLGEFLGELFLWLIRFWKVVFVPLAEYTYPVIIATGWSEKVICSGISNLVELDGIYFESVKKRECEESILAESGSYGNSPSFSESKDFMSLNSMQKRNGGLEKINGGDTSVADMCFDAYGFEQKKELATSIRSPVWNDGYGRKDLEDDDIARKAYYAGRHDWHGYGEEQRDNFTYHERSESLNYSFDGFSTGPADFEDDDIGTDLYGMENRVVEISKLTLRSRACSVGSLFSGFLNECLTVMKSLVSLSMVFSLLAGRVVKPNYHKKRKAEVVNADQT